MTWLGSESLGKFIIHKLLTICLTLLYAKKPKPFAFFDDPSFVLLFSFSVSKWIPRMDVAESRLAYNVVIELPGVNADEIRVEVNNDR